MNWRRFARIAVGVVGLGCAAALLVLRRDRPTVTPAPPIDVGDPSTQSQQQRGQMIFMNRKTGAVRATLSYERTRKYEDGRMRFEKTRLKMEGEDPFELWADSADVKSKRTSGEMPDEIDLSDGIVMKTPSGFHLESDRGTYRDSTGTLHLPGALTFGRDRMSGSGTGAVHRSKANTLELLADARITVAPDAAGAGALNASSRTMVLNRTEHLLHLDGSAAMLLDAQTLQAGKINAVLTEDEQTITSVKLIGGASVTPAAGAKNPGPGMKGEAIDLTLRPDGRTVQRAVLAKAAEVALGRDSLRAPWVDVQLAADGATVTRLEAREGVRADVAAGPEIGARTIDARTLVSQGTAEKGLTSARFEGDVVFKELPVSGSGAPLEGTSRVLVLALSGGLGAIESAEFRQNVKFTDTVVDAEAPRAVYDAARDRLVLHPGERAADPRPTVRDARVRLWGDLVDIHIGTHDLVATGRVETRTVPNAPTAKRQAAAGLFDRTREVLGSAPEVRYANTSGRATYMAAAGVPARVWQEENVVTADEISLDDATQNLTAKGRVESDLEMTSVGGTGEGKPTRHRIQSDTADFDHAARRAIFRGRRVALKGDDQEVIGSALEFRLAPETRALEGFTVTGDVEARLPGGNEAIGGRLVFDARARRYQLAGGADVAVVKSPGEPGAPCVFSIGSAFELDEVKKGFRRLGSGSFAETKEKPCDTPLRSLR